MVVATSDSGLFSCPFLGLPKLDQAPEALSFAVAGLLALVVIESDLHRQLAPLAVGTAYESAETH